MIFFTIFAYRPSLLNTIDHPNYRFHSGPVSKLLCSNNLFPTAGTGSRFFASRPFVPLVWEGVIFSLNWFSRPETTVGHKNEVCLIEYPNWQKPPLTIYLRIPSMTWLRSSWYWFAHSKPKSQRQHTTTARPSFCQFRFTGRNWPGKAMPARNGNKHFLTT